MFSLILDQKYGLSFVLSRIEKVRGQIINIILSETFGIRSKTAEKEHKISF